MNEATALSLEVTQKLLNLMGFNAEVSAELIGSEEGIQVDTGDQAILIGKGGENLKAIQYIVHQIVRKQLPDAAMVTIDVAGYRKARLHKIDEIIQEASAKVKDTNQSVELSPMNAYERRYVHSVLAENSELTTTSSGEEPNRRIVIQKA